MPTFDFTCEVCGAHGREHRPDKPPRFCSKKCKSRGLAGISLKPVKYVVTPEMHDQIERVYKTSSGNGEVRNLAKRLGLPRWKVTRYATAQGWVPRSTKAADWSEKELLMLEHLAYLSPERISARMKKAGLQRTPVAIHLKRRRMRFLQASDFYSARQTAECFGVDVHTIMRWIRLGTLKARKRGTNRTEAQGGDIWMIKPEYCRYFIIKYPEEVDIRKVDKFWFIDLLVER